MTFDNVMSLTEKNIQTTVLFRNQNSTDFTQFMFDVNKTIEHKQLLCIVLILIGFIVKERCLEFIFH